MQAECERKRVSREFYHHTPFFLPLSTTGDTVTILRSGTAVHQDAVHPDKAAEEAGKADARRADVSAIARAGSLSMTEPGKQGKGIHNRCRHQAHPMLIFVCGVWHFLAY